MFVFGVDATKTPVEEVICMVGGADKLVDDVAEGIDSNAPTEAVPEMKVVLFVVKPKLVSALVWADTTVLVPEFSVNGGNDGRADC